MLSSVAIADTPDFSVRSVRCGDDHSRWSAPERVDRHMLVLVRSGRFRMRSNGGRLSADPTMGYLQVPGDEQCFAHPAGGDVCTSIAVSDGLWSALAGETMRPAPAVQVDGRLDLAHRMMLRTASDADYTAAERVLGLLAEALRRQPGRTPADDPVRPGRSLADSAREALLAGHPDAAGLVSLARLLNVSPYHLSRVFRRETGLTLSRYRNRVRVNRALERLESGEQDLAGLAADLGFADHAHLSRTVKIEAGRTPAQIRRLLNVSPSSS